MGTTRNYLFSSLLESWSPEKLRELSRNGVEVNLEKSSNSFTCLQVCHSSNRPKDTYLGKLYVLSGL